MTKLEMIRDSMGGGNKSTGGRQRKVLSKRNQEGATTDKAWYQNKVFFYRQPCYKVCI